MTNQVRFIQTTLLENGSTGVAGNSNITPTPWSIEKKTRNRFFTKFRLIYKFSRIGGLDSLLDFLGGGAGGVTGGSGVLVREEEGCSELLSFCHSGEFEF